MIQVYNNELNQTDTFSQEILGQPVKWNNMLRDIQGTTYRVGSSKITSGQVPSYEFLFVDMNQEGQYESRYYSMTANGNFTDTRGLSSFDVEYIVNVDGRDVPCTARLLVNAGELIDINNMTLNPVITPAVASVDPQRCYPNQMTDVYNMLIEFASFHNIKQNITNRESISDFTAGR
jgi:hypothetical protein